MITKSLFVLLFVIALPVFADSLIDGAVYFDSAQTLNEVIKLSEQHDNEGIAKLIDNGHVKKQIGDEKEIVVLISGSTAESPVEFRFMDGPTTYWTVTRYIAGTPKPLPSATLSPLESASAPEPIPAQSPAPTVKRHQRQSGSDAPLDDDNGRRIWHQVNGKWKWYPAGKHLVPQ